MESLPMDFEWLADLQKCEPASLASSLISVHTADDKSPSSMLHDLRSLKSCEIE